MSNPETVLPAVSAPAGAYAARVPLAQAAAVHAGALLLILLLAMLLPDAAPRGDAMRWALLQGIVAALLGRGFGMDSWWLAINAGFVPGLVWALGFGLSPAYALGAFCLLVSLYWGVSQTRVPLFPSSRTAARAVAELLPRERSFTFVDLGCGPGGVLAWLARARPQGRYYGIESAPVPYLLSRLRAMLAAQPYGTRWGDFHELDLGGYDVVYAYLSPAAMPALWQKARREMRPGSLLISNSFAVPGAPPANTIALGARGGATLLLWLM